MIEWLIHSTILNSTVQISRRTNLIDDLFSSLEKIDNHQLCRTQINSHDLEMFREAIEEHYYFEFVIDDIPIRNFVGYLEETNIFPHKHNIYLYTHYHFDFLINNNQVNSLSRRRKHFLAIHSDHLRKYLN